MICVEMEILYVVNGRWYRTEVCPTLTTAKGTYAGSAAPMDDRFGYLPFHAVH